MHHFGATLHDQMALTLNCPKVILPKMKSRGGTDRTEGQSLSFRLRM